MTNNKDNKNNRSPVESRAAFARRLGVNRSTITRAAQAGRIVLNLDGKVLIQESLNRWETTKGARKDVEARHAQARGQSVNMGELSDAEWQTEAPIGELAAYKAQALQAKNETTLIARALEQGEAIEKIDHLHDLAKMGAQLRQTVENLIDNIAPQISGINTPGLVHSRIKRAIKELDEMYE